jgi:hypothetical protein
MAEKKITHSFYESAPDMLLDSIAEVNSLLLKVRAKSGENESFKFWKKVSDVMKFTWDYCQNIRWVIERNAFLERENGFLKEYATDLSQRLNKYEVIRQERIQGTLEETISRVDEFLKTKEDGQ